MKRDANKKRIYRLKVNDEGRRIIQAAILNRLILDGVPIDPTSSSSTDKGILDAAIIDGNCVVQICADWSKIVASKISKEDLDDGSDY